MTPMCDELIVEDPPMPSSTDDGLLTFNRVKIFGDGSLGAGTAAIAGEGGKGKGGENCAACFNDCNIES